MQGSAHSGESAHSGGSARSGVGKGADSGLLSALAAIVGSGGVLTGDDVSNRARGIWDGAGIEARAIVRPRSTEEVSRVLALCHAADQAVVPHGGLTGLVDGALSQPTDIALSLERMDAIEEVSVAERTLTAEAGAVLDAAQNAVDACGLLLPLDLGSRGSCTIGGNIATNAGGNRVIRYGMMRDMVLGLEAVLADGTVVSSLNRMIKNNAGYDVKQLFIGSEGSLGVVTRAVLRLREKPRSQETMLVAAADFGKIAALLKMMDSRLGGSLSAFEVLWNNFYRLVTTPPSRQKPPLAQTHPYYALIEAMGGDAADDRVRFERALEEAYEGGLVADAVVARSEAQRRALWAIRDDVEQLHQYKPMVIFDVSVRLAKMESYVAQVNSRLRAAFGSYVNFAFGHIGDGNIHFGISPQNGGNSGNSGDVALRIKQAVYEPLSAFGGSVSAEHGIGLDKKRFLRLSRSAEEIALMHAVKRALDPKGILNPGKVFDFS